MFLDLWKHKSIKRNIEKLVARSGRSSFSSTIKSVGILVDLTAFDTVKRLEKMALRLGDNISVSVLLYNDIENKKEDENLFFNDKAISFNGKIKEDKVTAFISKPFDLLLSYYNRENLVLQFVTAGSQAHFKVGFPLQMYQLNDLTIHVDLQNSSAFEAELLKYLKILNRIE